MAVIETFEAIFHGKLVYNPQDANNTCWSDPLTTFIYIACELLLPTAPFGGIGGSTPVLFFGKMRERDKVIAKIVSIVIRSSRYSARQIIDYRRTIINDLLSQYSDSTLPAYIREYASAAVRRFAQSTQILPYDSKLALITQHLVDNGWIPLPQRPPGKQHLQPDGNLVIHPFLAFFLGLPGYHYQSDDIQSYVVCDPTRYGKAWWECAGGQMRLSGVNYAILSSMMSMANRR
ncbi:hypothetical protein QFC22_004539 [Naganishia vaughanmartiniae]|uniref:Uncharacterized protein n=1 Tax=Naganishia vaughanmartiniae TaxID=1424756 RepID=A0ACC2X283_9TREE|nr:hypothetical protein QFC22_004539 [Naganishia vaughanmartiniae]